MLVALSIESNRKRPAAYVRDRPTKLAFPLEAMFLGKPALDLKPKFAKAMNRRGMGIGWIDELNPRQERGRSRRSPCGKEGRGAPGVGSAGAAV